MKVSELIKLLKKAGCQLVRHGSRHDIWENPATGNRFTVPRHLSEELKPKTQKSIMDAAGL